MNDDTPRTDAEEYPVWEGEERSTTRTAVDSSFARVLERENTRLRELITLLELAGEGMSEECDSTPHIIIWDAARDQVGLFLRLPNAQTE